MALPIIGRMLIATAELAGGLGVPYLAPVVSLIQQIQAACKSVILHKEQCEALSNKAVQLCICFMEKSQQLNESDLRTYSDELQSVLENINNRMNQWSQIGRIQAFLKDNEVAKQIEQADSTLDIAINKFKLNAAMEVQFAAERLERMIKPMFDVLVANPPEGLKQIQEHHICNGEDIGKQIMRTGQYKLKALRRIDHPPGEQGTPSERVMSAIRGRNKEYENVQRALTELYRQLGIKPTVQLLDGEITRQDRIPVAGGIYSDVWIGWWLGETKVALKALREVRNTEPKALKRFERELKVWSSLSHPNVLQFLGLVTDIGGYLQMVSPWQENGNILNFVRSNPAADRIHLLAGASRGLAYLHSQGIVHGNLRCSNILVSDKHEALICDFGMSKIVEDITEQSASATLSRAGSARWLAPEIIDGILDFPDMPCDVYAFGITMYECLTGTIPFASLKRDAQVIKEVTQKDARPDRPLGGNESIWITDEMWGILERCWKGVPQERLQMKDASELLTTIDSVGSG